MKPIIHMKSLANRADK